MPEATFDPRRFDRGTVNRALRESAGQVLETMFFISPGDQEPPEEVWPAARYTARLTFTGDRDGAFTILVPDCMAWNIATNFLADDQIPLERVEEVVREFANMVCGSTLSAIAPHASFNLAMPSLQAGVEAQGESYRDSLLSECGRMEMSLEFWPAA